MAEKKNKIELGLKDEPETMKVINEKSTKKVQVLSQLKNKVVNGGTLISNVNYPVIVKYGLDSIRVSPRSRMKIANKDLIGELPSGIILV